MKKPLKVLKFGGTSVGLAGSLQRAQEIIVQARSSHRVVVIASAASGVTDELVAAGAALEAGTFQTVPFLEALRVRHQELAAAVLSTASQAVYAVALREGLRALQDVFDQVHRRGLQPALRDAVLAAGERLSVPLVAVLLRDAGLEAVPVDAAPLIRTDDTHGEAVVESEQTHRLIRSWYQELPEDTVAVVTGFLGSTAGGATTTLGRGGSDYSAALFASALQADVLERWTDVDGIYTEDPRRNRYAKRLACIVLEEAWAWNHAGRLGMHRKALDPLVAAGIPVHVRSTAEPDKHGTLILPAGFEPATAIAATAR